MTDWQRLSPLMLLVHPVHEVLRQLPVLVGSAVLGSATGNVNWPLAVLGVLVSFGLLRWFFTTYRIDDENVALHTGVLRRRLVSLPRNRIRSVQTDARLLHRLFGLTVLRVATGQDAAGGAAFVLDAVRLTDVPGLRTVLLADGESPGAKPAGLVLARWRPSWLRYAPLSFSGLVTIAAAAGLAYQSGIGLALQERVAKAGADAAQHTSVVLVVGVGAGGLVLASVLLAVSRSALTYGNLLLARDGGVLHLRHGLVRVREHSFDLDRLRGGTLREPLPVRALRGARLDAAMTGVHGDGEASLLLPPCPVGTATAVLSELIGDVGAVTGPLQGHGPAAARRRWTRALAVPAAVGAIGAILVVPLWFWLGWAAVTAGCALLAADRTRALGHRVAGGWLVARSGSIERRRDCIACAGIVAWTVRQTFFQRRAGVATLIAATAAGRKRYQVIDVPAAQAWSVAAGASVWVAESIWAGR